MNRLLTAALAALLLASCGERAPSAPASPAQSAAQHDDAALNAFFEEVFERAAAESPLLEAQLGRKTERYGEWDDFSDEAAIRRNELAKSDLARLKMFDPARLSPAARTSYDVFAYQQEQAIANFAFRNLIYVAHHLDGTAGYLPVALRNLHRIDSTADAEAYVSRLERIETALKQIAERLAAQTDAGVYAPSFSYPYIIADVEKLLRGAPFPGEGVNAVYEDFTAKLDGIELDASQKDRLRARAEEALKGPFRRGYEAYLAEVRRAAALGRDQHGVWKLADGEAFYRNRIAFYTTLDLTADEVHETGLAEVARIQSEMEAIKRKVGFEGTLKAFFEHVRTDPNNYFPNTDEGREAFLERQRGLVAGIEAKAGDYFNLLPKAKLEVRRVEPFRENTAGIAFYNRPSADGTRPGVYYTNLKDMTAVQKYVHTAIGYHESVPGHHFQLALQQEMADLPAFRKFGGYGAFVEGWALYAELLAKEMGFYADPYEDLGRLQNEIWRAVRLVVDTGLHTRQWTREQAIAYFLDNTPLSEGDATAEVERYISRPGQALAYKIGMLKIQELRARAERALGPRFDIRAFHDVALENGAVPLATLEALVDRHIEAKRAAP